MTGMNIYAYAIIDSIVQFDDCITGMEGNIVFNIPYRDIGVVVSKFGEKIQNVTKDHVLKHEEVVEKLMRRFTVLPIRFLTQFSHEEDVLLMMQAFYNDFRENLDRVRNKVEFGVKIIWSGVKVNNHTMVACRKSDTSIRFLGSSPSRSFVKEKFEKYKAHKEFGEEVERYVSLIDDFFSRFAVEKKLEKLKTDKLLLAASYLVEKERQEDFKDAFKRARKTLGDLKFLLSGPWPPYNFVVLSRKTDMYDKKSPCWNISSEGEI